MSYDLVKHYAEKAGQAFAKAYDEMVFFIFAGLRRTRAGVLDLHKYRGKGRPRKTDYVPDPFSRKHPSPTPPGHQEV
jgi:hypothetical protein